MSALHYIDGSRYVEKERESWGTTLSALSNDDSTKTPVTGAQALWKGLSVLKIISEAPTPLRFGALMEISGMPKGTLHRILQALIEFKLVRADEVEQTYKLGTRLFEMAHKVWSEFDLRGAAEPELIRIKNFSGETSRLGILDESTVLIIDQKEAINPFRLALGVGQRLKLYTSAMGKAMLANMPPTKLHETMQLLELKRYTPNTITNKIELLNHLDLTKARGYAISVEEQFTGLNSVAAPILDHSGSPIGAISIAGSAYNMTPERLHNLGREVIEAARRVSGSIGEGYMSIATKGRPALSSENNWRCVVSSQAFLGEGPHWNTEKEHLEWVDILQPSVHISDPENNKDRAIPLSEIIGAMVPRRRGGHVAVTQFGYRAVDLETGEFTALASPKDMIGCRFNDGKCDAKGRFWAGTLALDASPNKGALYCLEEDGKLREVLTGLHISNGLGWNADSTKMYLTDSGKRTIYVFDYDLAAGTISNQKVFAELREEDGSPDGLAVDKEGGVWSVIWDGWRVIRYASNGIIDKVFDLPIPRPTSCAFGGKDLSTLYITSARIRLSSSMLNQSPLSGSVFAIETGVQGVPVSVFAG